MQDRLYILRVPSYQKLQIKPIQSTNTVDFTISDLNTLWHVRLGHVSNKCIMLSRINFLLLNIGNFVCVMFVILQNEKDFLFLLVHLNLKSVLI